MKQILLTQDRFALVSDEDFSLINKHKWSLTGDKKYATRGFGRKNKVNHILMHRLIINCPKGLEVDHINHNGLDNRRENLRIVTRSQNFMNREKFVKSSSVFKGVSLYKTNPKWVTNNKWRVCIQKDKKFISIGYFNTEVQAAMAYDLNAVALFGEYAKTNFNPVSLSVSPN